MTRDEVLVRVLEVVRRHAEPGVPLSPHARLRSDVGLDSLQAVMLGLDIESEFGIRLEEDALYAVHTVDQLTKLVMEHIAGTDGSGGVKGETA